MLCCSAISSTLIDGLEPNFKKRDSLTIEDNHLEFVNTSTHIPRLEVATVGIEDEDSRIPKLNFNIERSTFIRIPYF